MDVARLLSDSVERRIKALVRPFIVQRTLDDLVQRIDGTRGLACVWILQEHRLLFLRAKGSSHNHQAWPGGYFDHVAEVMNIAFVLHPVLSALRPLPFTRSDALLVLFLHDIEKPWKYELDAEGNLCRRVEFASKAEEKAEAKRFRDAKLKQYGIELTPEQANALRYVEGELDDYSGSRRVMNELAAFCHVCDVISARIWHDRPVPKGDPWPGARRAAS